MIDQNPHPPSKVDLAQAAVLIDQHADDGNADNIVDENTPQNNSLLVNLDEIVRNDSNEKSAHSRTDTRVAPPSAKGMANPAPIWLLAAGALAAAAVAFRIITRRRHERPLKQVEVHKKQLFSEKLDLSAPSVQLHASSSN